MDGEVRASWSPNWTQTNAVFESQLDWDPSFTSYKNKMFFIWDGNYRFLSWKNYIDRVHTEDYEHYVLMDSIIWGPQPEDIPSLLIVIHDIDKWCSYLLVFFQLFLVYIYIFKLYHFKFNQFNIFSGQPRIFIFPPIWCTLCIGCKTLVSCL